MQRRNLKITLDPDVSRFIRDAGRKAASRKYQGEILNFESVELFLGRLTPLRWNLVRALLGAGELSIRELARRVNRDVKRVHGDIAVLCELGLVERTESFGVRCPFDDIHIDLHLRKAA